MALWIATPKDEGFSAAHLGHPRCMNQYPPGTKESDMWYEGWDLANDRALEIANIRRPAGNL